MTPDRWQKIESIFEAAIDLPVENRQEYVLRACEGDLDLQREVSRLLASDESADDFIESPVWTDSNFLNSKAKKAISDSLDDRYDTARASDLIGRQVGVYRIVKEIGRGGMGAVLLAERADGEFSQKVAIKLIKRGMDSDFIIRRFRHERQILASFEHPYIARLLDGGTLPDGVPYFVMEYIEGQSLYNYADKHQLNIAARLKLFQKVCSAIEYAHERQIIHRDIKPSNILINKYGNPKLLDFGIAKVLDPDLIHESLNPTASLMRMMTPDYASPEQVKGEEITASSDIYSLGILLYELITGHRPYNFDGRALHEISRVICDVSPEIPSRVIDIPENLLLQYSASKSNFATARDSDPGRLKNTLSGNFDNIVMKALEKSPSDRYRSARELADDIGRHLAGQAVAARPYIPSRDDPGYQHLSSTGNSKALAILPFRFLNLTTSSETDDNFLGLGLADALISRLSKTRRFVVRPTNSILSFGDQPIDPVRAGRDLNVDFVLDGNIKKARDRLRLTVQLLNVRDNAAIWATSIDEKIADVFTLEDTLSRKLIEVLLPQLTGSELAEYSKRGTESPEAFEHYLRGRYYFNSFTEEGLAKAFVAFHQAIAADPTYAHAYSGIADYYNWLGIIGVLPPQECFQPAIDAASKAVELDSTLSEAHASLGFSLHAGNHDWEKAEFHLRRAIELNPSNANAYVWYSIVLCTEGRFTDALEFARRSVELDPLTPFNHHNVGWVLYFARRYDEGITHYKQLDNDFPDYSFTHYGLSKIYRMTGRTEDALLESEKTRRLMDDSVFALLAEAECLAADGQKERAAEKIEYLESLAVERYVSPYQMSLIYCFLNDPEKALDLLEKAAAIKEAWLNWLGVEPAFDPIRNDDRFNEISSKFGYRGFLESSMTGVRRTADPARPSFDRTKGGDEIHNMTTLVIDQGGDTAETLETEDVTPLSLLPRRVAIIAGFASLILILITAGIFLSKYGISPKSSDQRPEIKVQKASLLVLPFSTDDPGLTDVGVGMADALSNRLGNIKSLTIISSSTGRSLANASLEQIQMEIGPAFVLKGKLKGPPDDMTLDAELLALGENKPIWSTSFSQENEGLAGIQTRLAERIWSSLGIDPLPLEREQIYKGFPTNNAAYQLYLIGRYQMANRSSENIRKSIDTFSRAIEKDPGFALGYVGMADSLALLNLYDVTPPKNAYALALENVNKALAIDDDLAEAHASLAYVKFYHQRDRTGAELEFRRAIQMNPSYAQAHHWFALALAGMNRPVEALTEAQTAERLDPRSPAIKAATAIVYFMNGNNAEALNACDRALAKNDSFVPALKVKRWVYTLTGDRKSAYEILQREMSYSGGTSDDPGWKIIEEQLVSPAMDRQEHLKELAAATNGEYVRNNDYVFAFEIALAYNNLGDTEKALRWLERAEAANSHSFSFLNVEPRISNLRDLPGFQRIAKKYDSENP